MTHANTNTAAAKTKFLVRELQNLQSHRDGEIIEAKDLPAAKRKASREQVFHGTVLVIEDLSGNRLAHKESGSWINAC